MAIHIGPALGTPETSPQGGAVDDSSRSDGRLHWIVSAPDWEPGSPSDLPDYLEGSVLLSESEVQESVKEVFGLEV